MPASHVVDAEDGMTGASSGGNGVVPGSCGISASAELVGAFSTGVPIVPSGLIQKARLPFASRHMMVAPSAA